MVQEGKFGFGWEIVVWIFQDVASFLSESQRKVGPGASGF